MRRGVAEQTKSPRRLNPKRVRVRAPWRVAYGASREAAKRADCEGE
jgi:hypothetical protein